MKAKTAVATGAISLLSIGVAISIFIILSRVHKDPARIVLYYCGLGQITNISINDATATVAVMKRGDAISKALKSEREKAIDITYLYNGQIVRYQTSYMGPGYTGEIHIVIDQAGIVCQLDRLAP